MAVEREKQVETRNPARDENGRLLPGHTANPNGRPKGLSITEMVREALKSAPEGSRETYGDMFVKRILHKAIKEGDQVMMKAVWAYMDGQPKQQTDITSGGRSFFPILGSSSNALLPDNSNQETATTQEED